MTINKQEKYDQLADKLIRKYADYEREEFEDRNVLERKIFPWVLANLEPHKILDIGREEYQKFYNKFFAKRELWTMDFDPERHEWGSKDHIIGDAAEVGEHFRENYFDFILMNGVYGWGLNEKEKIEKCFEGIYRILKPGGLFILGYNDWDAIPMKVEDVENLKKLSPFVFPPLNSEKFKCINGEHTYQFYKK